MVHPNAASECGLISSCDSCKPSFASRVCTISRHDCSTTSFLSLSDSPPLHTPSHSLKVVSTYCFWSLLQSSCHLELTCSTLRLKLTHPRSYLGDYCRPTTQKHHEGPHCSRIRCTPPLQYCVCQNRPCAQSGNSKRIMHHQRR
ncbi:hypothetical protein B0O80DRAFT_259636 [Mortierella sp. GBAus27b]|nr:hypothetical protein B0O80DRAFT_259636 [Mortierella sp. GBAus27b]